MNILFFLTPKSEVAYIPADESLRQAFEKLKIFSLTQSKIL